jgi:hypothetical protein
MLRKLAGNYFVLDFPLESNIDGWLVPGGDGIQLCYSKKKKKWGVLGGVGERVTVFYYDFYSILAAAIRSL